MNKNEQVGDPKIIIQLWLDNKDGVKFNAHYDASMIDREQAKELSVFESVIIHQVFLFLNTIEGLHNAFGYQEDSIDETS